VSKKNKPNSYDATDNKFVKDINKVEEAIDDQRLAGGKLVDKYVLGKGGIQYGAGTIESIAQHPDILVRAETLRRWWAYYRIYEQMGDEIASIYPNPRTRDYYELARILDASILTRDGESQEDARCRTILEIANWLAGKRKCGRISCDEVRIMVTKVIDASSADYVIKNNSQADDKPDRRSKVGKAIAFTNIKDAVDYLTNFSEPKHLASAGINNTELCLEMNRMGDSFVRLADHLAHAGHEETVCDLLNSVRHKIDEIEARMAPSRQKSPADSDTGVKIGGV